jgi:glycosyltransferase involved in cell wall biosynthesis
MTVGQPAGGQGTTVVLASIVLPVFNQADHIERTLREYASSLELLPFGFEILPVVNGPRRDRSLEICRAVETELACVRTLCIEAGGWGRAVRTGLAEARGDLLCFTNATRTSGSELASTLDAAAHHPNSVVKATRAAHDNLKRRLGSSLYNLECRALFNLTCRDINATPKVFPRRLARLLQLSRDDDLLDLEFQVVCREAGYPVLEVPLEGARRTSSPSTTNWRSALRLYAGAYRFRHGR